MKKYKFRLQTVLDMREKALEEKRLDMARVVKLVNESLEKLDGLNERENQLQKTLYSFYQEGVQIDVSAIATYGDYIKKIANDIRKQKGVVDHLNNILKIKQEQVNEALKQVKILESLKEKQEKTFLRAIEEYEVKELDDIAITRYGR